MSKIKNDDIIRTRVNKLSLTTKCDNVRISGEDVVSVFEGWTIQGVEWFPQYAEHGDEVNQLNVVIEKDYEEEAESGNLEIAERFPSADVSGRWECLGHQIGYLKHPYSIDYRCSVCGYKLYTVFGCPPLPDRCPHCGAIMEGAEDD